MKLQASLRRILSGWLPASTVPMISRRPSRRQAQDTASNLSNVAPGYARLFESYLAFPIQPMPDDSAGAAA